MSTRLQCLLEGIGRAMPRKRGSGNGWISKANGEWVGRFRDYSTGIGRVIQRQLGSIKTVSERDAKKKLAAEIRNFTPSATMTFAAAAALYIELRSSGWVNGSKRTVESIVRSHILPVLGNMQVGLIKASHIQACLNTIAKSGSESLVNKARTHIGGTLELLVGDDILVKNPARTKHVKKPKTRKSDNTVISLAEIRLLIGAAHEERDRVLLMILFSCAFRPSEVFALRLDDVRDGKLYIDEVAIPYEVAKNEGKTAGSFAGVPISHDLDLEIRMYAMRNTLKPDDFLFATPLRGPMPHSYWKIKILQPLAEKVGIKRVNYQIIRRTVATLAQEYGNAKDIQSLLRHKNIQTTLGVYVQPIAESGVRMANDWNDAIRGKVN